MSMPSSSSTARHWVGSLPWASHRVQLRSWSPWRGKSVGNWRGSLLTWRKNKGALHPSKRKHTALSLLGRPTVPFCPLSGSVVLVFTMRLRFEEILAGLGVRRACCSWVLLMANGCSLAWSPFSSFSLFPLVNVFPSGEVVAQAKFGVPRQFGRDEDRPNHYLIRPVLFLFYIRNLQVEYEQLKEQHLRRGLPVGSPPESIVSPHHTSEDSELIAEAKLLRQHKGRLEARMQILEDHNKQLESQLHRLRQLLEQVGGWSPVWDLYKAPVHVPGAWDWPW